MATWLRHLNHAPFWKGYARAWGAEIYHPSFDRWLYLLLNRFGLQGSLSRRVIEDRVRRGDIVVDIGGNIGLYTALLSRAVGPAGRVFTFEPVPVLHDAVQRTLARNAIANVELSAHALGARVETVGVVLDPLNSGNNWLSHEAARTSGLVSEVRPLDGFELGGAPSFIKIDVQGWEVEVLRGMDRILTGPEAPVLYCEVSGPALKAAGSTPAQLGRILADHGYSLRVASMEQGRLRMRPITLEELADRAERVLYFDILALPPGRAAA